MNKIKRLIFVIFGTAITGLSISTLLTPNKIVCGGVSGVATIIYHVFDFSTGATFAIVNIILLFLGIKILGRKFTVNTLLGAGLLSLFVEIFSYLPPITENTYLASLFGGFLYGLGIGITFSVNATTGGTDILSRIIQHYFPHFNIGRILLFVDGCVVFTSLIVFKNVELVLFGILTLVFSTFSIDWFISKLNVSRIAFVITEKGVEISKYLVSTSKRGVTMLKAIGAYTYENKELLFCALKNNEVEDFEKKILEIDEMAFIVYSESSTIKGNGFYIYR